MTYNIKQWVFKILLVGLMVLPSLVMAQPAMNQQNMMQMMQQAQACFANVDMKAVEALGQRAKAMEAELKSLCASGERAKAQQKAIAFGMEIAKHPEMEKLRNCTADMGKMAASMMPKIPDYSDAEKYKNKHLCDSIGGN